MKMVLPRSYAFMILIAAITLSPVAACGQKTQQKKLIEFGWDMPTTFYLHDNIAKLEASPFDGVVLSAVGWEDKDRIDLFALFWGGRKLTKPQFQSALELLKTTPFKRLTDNFLRINIAYTDVDWFDETRWRTILANAEIAAWLCKEGNLKGILFDTEQYVSNVFSYNDRPQKRLRTYEEYRTQIQRRGKELARAITAIKPDSVFLFTYATSMLSVRGISAPSAQPAYDYGLLPAFIDGMLEGADPRATLCDGQESSYLFKNKSQFDNLKDTARKARKFSQRKSQYDARMTYGFGLWLDGGGAQYKWNPMNPSQNFFTPEVFQKSIELALKASDRYVWIYTEKIDWWTGEGISPAYLDAIKAARQKAGLP